MYIPFAQTHGPADEATFAIRTSQDPCALTPAVREILRSLAPDLPLLRAEDDGRIDIGVSSRSPVPDNSDFTFWWDRFVDRGGGRVRRDFIFGSAADT